MTATLPSAASSVALVLLDFQPSVLSSVAGADDVVAGARAAAAVVSAAGGHVLFVRVAFEDDDYNAFPATSLMGARVKNSRPAMDAGSPTAAVHPSLEASPGDIVRKTRVGAFSTTDLHERLQGRGVTTLVVAGVHTSGAVLTTVREAHDLDYRVVVVRDASADPDPDVDEFLMTRIFPKQASVVTGNELRHAIS